MPLKPLVDGVLSWNWYSEEKGLNFNGYAVRLTSGLVVLDPAYADEPLWRELESPQTPSAILLTNKDHERASGELRRRWKCPVLIHEADAPLLQEPPDETFGDAGIVFGALTPVRFTRLKSPGECAFLWTERRILFVGDAVVGKPGGKLGVVKKHEGNPAVLEDLKRLLLLDFDAILMGDGEPILTGGQAALRDFLRV